MQTPSMPRKLDQLLCPAIPDLDWVGHDYVGLTIAYGCAGQPVRYSRQGGVQTRRRPRCLRSISIRMRPQPCIGLVPFRRAQYFLAMGYDHRLCFIRARLMEKSNSIFYFLEAMQFISDGGLRRVGWQYNRKSPKGSGKRQSDCG